MQPDFSSPTGGWKNLIDEFKRGPEFASIIRAVEESDSPVYPPQPFRAFEKTDLEEVKVVVIGQDPYHTPGKAMGLAFSVPSNEKTPPSLRNIFKELEAEYGRRRTNTDLTDWAEQGVFLINASLTVEKGRPLSHSRLGWQKLVDEAVSKIAARGRVVFLLWGRDARARKTIIDKSRGRDVLVLESNHPSPLSAGKGDEPFLGCGHFKRANEFLESIGGVPIDWIGTEKSEDLFS